jgi:hypothetical protein
MNVKSRLLVLFLCGPALAISALSAQSIAREWDEQILAAIRIDTPHPPAQARNLFSLSVCMYDAWAAYTNGPVGYVYRGKHTATNIAAARREAISYAAYRILRERYFYSRSASNTLATLDAYMASLGYPTNVTTRNTSTPAGVGNSIYDAVSAWFINDGARQTNGTQAAPYPDYPANQGRIRVYQRPAARGSAGDHSERCQSLAAFADRERRGPKRISSRPDPELSRDRSGSVFGLSR